MDKLETCENRRADLIQRLGAFYARTDYGTTPAELIMSLESKVGGQQDALDTCRGGQGTLSERLQLCLGLLTDAEYHQYFSEVMGEAEVSYEFR
jgi:DNA-binding SARP family transcriptional activator